MWCMTVLSNRVGRFPSCDHFRPNLEHLKFNHEATSPFLVETLSGAKRSRYLGAVLKKNQRWNVEFSSPRERSKVVLLVETWSRHDEVREMLEGMYLNLTSCTMFVIWLVKVRVASCYVHVWICRLGMMSYRVRPVDPGPNQSGCLSL